MIIREPGTHHSVEMAERAPEKLSARRLDIVRNGHQTLVTALRGPSLPDSGIRLPEAGVLGP